MNIDLYDQVRVTTADGAVFEGMWMPRTQFSDENTLILKLSNGYNIGLAAKDSKIELISKGTESEIVASSVAENPELPTIAVLGTGGTIASFVDYRTGGVQPATSPEELIAAAPELRKFCNVRSEVVFQMFSEDMQPEHWSKLATRVAWHLNNGCVGVVIAHGTDTMSYTSSALSFSLDELRGPVVLVGSQRSSDRPSSDASMNLVAACTVAANAKIGAVLVAMHETSEDTRVALHLGTRVRKMHTSRRDAFQSINVLPVGYVEGSKITWAQTMPAASKATTTCTTEWDEEVSMIVSYPGLWPEHIEDVVRKATIIVGTGLGHIARRCLPGVESVIERGAHVAMTSQCIHGRVNMNVYATGRDLLKLGVLPADDMLPEVAYVKMMWLLANRPFEVRKLFRVDLAGEIGSPTEPLAFGTNPPATSLEGSS